jgi:hypothetical protein
LLQGILTPFIICSINFLTVFLTLFLGWFRFGRNTLPPHQLGQGLLSLVRRLAFYARLYFGRKANSWIRTDRSKRD